MTTVRFRAIRYRLMRWHSRGRFAPFCRDCRWLRESQRDGEFYAHDDPRWYIDEILPCAPRTWSTGQGQTWTWDVEHGARRVS